MISHPLFRTVSMLAIVGAVATGAQAQQSTPLPPQNDPHDGLMVWSIDKDISPCENLYQHACNGWLKANPIPPDQTAWGVDSQLAERTRLMLREILENAASHPDADNQRIGDFYAACMDEAGIEAKGLAPLAPLLDRINGLTDKKALSALTADLHRIGADVFFSFGSEHDRRKASLMIAAADQGGIGMPERDYYFKKDKKSVDLRTAYVAHLANLLVLTGSDAAKAKIEADAVMALETRLAEASLTAVRRRDPSATYHPTDLKKLAGLTPAFDWTTYLKAVGTPKIKSINVAVPAFLTAVDQIIADTPLETVKTYLRAHLVTAAAALLPRAFVNENFSFYGQTLAGAKELKPRWKRCVALVDSDLGEDLGKIYVKTAFGPESKAAMKEMLINLRTAFQEDIKALPWMSAPTKAYALKKLAVMAEKVGYPDHWRDYSPVKVVHDDALGNHQRAVEFDAQRQLNKINRPVDKGEWFMTPPTVNAYYSGETNDINFPAGILQPPYFDVSWDAAINYGATGSTIGHEMTHGFDDQGRLFDADGNLRDWWQKQDTVAFKERAACIVDEANQFTAIDEVKLNGSLTLGENTADNGGIRLALAAFHKAIAGKKDEKIDGYTQDQRFFLAYAQSWCEHRTPDATRMQALTNPHATAEFRVNGVVANLPEFRQAFSCKIGDAMAPKKMCRVW